MKFSFTMKHTKVYLTSNKSIGLRSEAIEFEEYFLLTVAYLSGYLSAQL